MTSPAVRSLLDAMDVGSRRFLKRGEDPFTGVKVAKELAFRNLARVQASGLWPGRYLVIARQVESGCAVAQIELGNKESKSVTLNLEPGCLVRAGRPLPSDARIELRRTGMNAFFMRGGAEGIAHVPGGRYGFALRFSGAGSVSAGEVLVPSAGVFDLAVPAVRRCTVRGVVRILDASGKDAGPGKDLLVRLEHLSQRCDVGGRFSFDAVPAGASYSLEVKGYKVSAADAKRLGANVPEDWSSPFVAVQIAVSKEAGDALDLGVIHVVRTNARRVQTYD